LPILPLKFSKQPETAYCFPSCLKMVIDYAIDELKVKQKRLRLSSIAKIVKTHPNGGTAPGDIELINAALLDSFPEIQIVDSKGGTFTDIRKEIDEEKLVIAWIVVAKDEEDTLFHSIVINGYDDNLTKIFYVDPEMEQNNYQLSAPIGKFIDEMLTVDGHLIRMKITIKGQQDLFKRLLPLKKTRKRKDKNE